MKRLSLKWKTFVLALSLGIIPLALASCKSLSGASAVVQSGSEWFNIVQRSDTVVVRDSIFVSERQRGDTVYLTQVEWRDRWRTRVIHDTVVQRDSIVQVIEHPPERYVPKFYKRCTWALWISIAAIVGWVFIRWKICRF